MYHNSSYYCTPSTDRENYQSKDDGSCIEGEVDQTRQFECMYNTIYPYQHFRWLRHMLAFKVRHHVKLQAFFQSILMSGNRNQICSLRDLLRKFRIMESLERVNFEPKNSRLQALNITRYTYEV